MHLKIERVTLPPVRPLLLPRLGVKLLSDPLALLGDVLSNTLHNLPSPLDPGPPLLHQPFDSPLPRRDVSSLDPKTRLAREELLLDADGQDELAVRTDLGDARGGDVETGGGAGGGEDRAEVGEWVGRGTAGADGTLVEVVERRVGRREELADLFFELYGRRV